MIGSSPLSRGIHGLGIADLDDVGIIPALAGNTRGRGGAAALHRDHPRSRGEYSRPRWRGSPAQGSSPLSRGIRGWVAARTGGQGIIPALAGNTCWRAWMIHPHADHPRSRGEYSLRAAHTHENSGSSPLSRGILCSAGAGPSDDVDHPRSRGEYWRLSLPRWEERGSSPLSRGIRF